MFTVLGATGYIGSQLVATLILRGEKVMAPLRTDDSFLSSHLGHVIYAVGLTADFRGRPFDTMRAHVGFLTDILEYGRFDSLTYLSSTRVYSRSSRARTTDEIAVNVSDPSDLYNISKLAGESLCLQSGRQGVRVARLSNVVGAGCVNSDNFIDSLVKDALGGRVVFRSSACSSKDYICLDDVIDLLPKIATAGREEIYNLASGRNLMNSQWEGRIKDLLGCHIEYLPEAPVLDFPTIEIRNLIQEFSFSPRAPLDTLPQLISRYSLKTT